MFEFGKKKLLAQMSEFVDNIGIAIYAAVLQEQSRLGNREDKMVAGAVANRLIGRDFHSSHTDYQKQAAKSLAEAMMRRDYDIFIAAVMCVRTEWVKHSVRKDEAFISWEMNTMAWLGTVRELPNEKPGPDSMRRLAYYMMMKYCPNSVEIR
jgi:hypothetical protein